MLYGKSGREKVHDLHSFQEQGFGEEEYSASEHTRKLKEHLKNRENRKRKLEQIEKSDQDSSDDEEELTEGKPVWYYLNSNRITQGPLKWSCISKIGVDFPSMLVWKKGQENWVKFEKISKAMSGSDLWYYKIGQKEMGPAGTWELVNRVTAGNLNRNMLTTKVLVTAPDRISVWKPMFEWPEFSMLNKDRGGDETVLEEVYKPPVAGNYKHHLTGTRVVISNLEKIDEISYETDKLNPWPHIPGEPSPEELQRRAGPNGWGEFSPSRGLVGMVIYHWPMSDLRLVKVEAQRAATLGQLIASKYEGDKAEGTIESFYRKMNEVSYVVISSEGLIASKHQNEKKETKSDKTIAPPPGLENLRPPPSKKKKPNENPATKEPEYEIVAKEYGVTIVPKGVKLLADESVLNEGGKVALNDVGSEEESAGEDGAEDAPSSAAESEEEEDPGPPAPPGIASPTISDDDSNTPPPGIPPEWERAIPAPPRITQSSISSQIRVGLGHLPKRPPGLPQKKLSELEITLDILDNKDSRCTDPLVNYVQESPPKDDFSSLMVSDDELDEDLKSQSHLVDWLCEMAGVDFSSQPSDKALSQALEGELSLIPTHSSRTRRRCEDNLDKYKPPGAEHLDHERLMEYYSMNAGAKMRPR